jgi:hypothetical protein
MIKKEKIFLAFINVRSPPIALAGPDQAITLPTDGMLLDGNPTSNPDGRISVWPWTKYRVLLSYT